MNKANESLPKPSLKALEAAATIRLTNVVKDSNTKPSMEAVKIAAHIMAKTAARNKD